MSPIQEHAMAGQPRTMPIGPYLQREHKMQPCLRIIFFYVPVPDDLLDTEGVSLESADSALNRHMWVQ